MTTDRLAIGAVGHAQAGIEGEHQPAARCAVCSQLFLHQGDGTQQCVDDESEGESSNCDQQRLPQAHPAQPALLAVQEEAQRRPVDPPGPPPVDEIQQRGQDGEEQQGPELRVVEGVG